MNVNLKDGPSLRLSNDAIKAQLEIIEQRANILINKHKKGKELGEDIMSLAQSVHLLYRTLNTGTKASKTRIKNALNYASISADSACRFDETSDLVELHGVYSLNALGRYVQW